MLATYLKKAMEMAIYEIIEDDHSYWEEIPNIQGVWANHETLEGCRNEIVTWYKENEQVHQAEINTLLKEYIRKH